MKRLTIPLGLALAALSLLAAGTPAHAGERPIRAEGRGVLNVRDDSAGLVGWGQSEHLGPCVMFIPLDFDELVQYGNLVPLNLRLGARNGDQLYAAVDSEFDPETGIIAATITFTGGTGRFADATGSARLLIAPDTDWFFFGARFSWALEGTIDY